MAKVRIKSEKIKPFGGIFHVRELFTRFVGPVIDKVLGLRSTSFGYQYGEIVGSLSSIITILYYYAVIFVWQKSAQVYNVGNVIGWRQSPCSILVHDKREVLIVIIGIIMNRERQRIKEPLTP